MYETEKNTTEAIDFPNLNGAVLPQHRSGREIRNTQTKKSISKVLPSTDAIQSCNVNISLCSTLKFRGTACLVTHKLPLNIFKCDILFFFL